jgi:phenylacetate-CoA ligase
MHVIETSFIAELLPLNCDVAAAVESLPNSVSTHVDSELRELVLTSLGRYGAPVIRYRTGDVVNARIPTSGDCRFLWLEGGVRGRTDDMRIIRGVNVFPSSIDAILREFDCISEYQVTVSDHLQLDELRIEVEAPIDQLESIRKRLEIALGLRIEVSSVPFQSLPRHEGKAKRWIDHRKNQL